MTKYKKNRRKQVAETRPYWHGIFGRISRPMGTNSSFASQDYPAIAPELWRNDSGEVSAMNET